jgi:hypothetical protein
MLKQFPNYFPKGCPPKEAIEKEISAYRLTKNNPALVDDFKPHAILNPKKKYNDIKAYGLSVFTDYNEISTVMKLNPKMRKFKFITIGTIFKGSGVILETPNENHKSHVTWWLYNGIKPHTFFRTC